MAAVDLQSDASAWTSRAPTHSRGIVESPLVAAPSPETVMPTCSATSVKVRPWSRSSRICWLEAGSAGTLRRMMTPDLRSSMTPAALIRIPIPTCTGQDFLSIQDGAESERWRPPSPLLRHGAMPQPGTPPAIHAVGNRVGQHQSAPALGDRHQAGCSDELRDLRPTQVEESHCLGAPSSALEPSRLDHSCLSSVRLADRSRTVLVKRCSCAPSDDNPAIIRRRACAAAVCG
jgi:hypothetical protein